MESFICSAVPFPHGLRRPTSNSLHPAVAEVLGFLTPLSQDYPGFELWFRTKVVPGLVLGTRRIVRVERNNRIIAVGIAKLEPHERKICTVRVCKSYFGRGIGLKVFDELLRWLDTDKPHLTVSEDKIAAFERIFDWYGFKLTSRKKGIYLPHAWEFGYNESILNSASSKMA